MSAMNGIPLASIVCALLLSGCASRAPQPQSEGVPERAAAQPGGFERTLELQGIRFQVSCSNNSSVNKLVITPAGLELDNTPITRDVEGTVMGAEIADLNADGSPEIYVYVTSARSGSYGTLAAYSVNKRKSLSEIFLPAVADDPKASQGYRGHDEFAIVENTLVQRFPIYGEGEANAKPSGKTRQVQYKLKQGEASWVLKADRILEY